MNTTNKTTTTTTGDPLPQDTATAYQQPGWVNYGWVCPLCGRALSPWTSVCHCRSADILTLPYRITCKLP